MGHREPLLEWQRRALSAALRRARGAVSEPRAGQCRPAHHGGRALIPGHGKWLLSLVIAAALVLACTQQAIADTPLFGFNEGYAQRLPEVTYAEREYYASKAALSNAAQREATDLDAALRRARGADAALLEARARDDERLRSLVSDSRAAGATVARFTIVWKHVEPRPGRFSWGYYDRVYHELLIHGIHPLPVLIDSPLWARPSRPRLTGDTFAASYPDRRFTPEWERFASGVAERYPESVAIEVWNEPNAARFWGGVPSPRRYAELLQSAYDGIKRVRSDMPVLLAGPAPRIARPFQWDRFLRGAYEHGAAAHSDDLSLHPYATESGPQIAQVLEGVRRARELVRDHHPGARIWVTELGFPTHPQARNAVSELRQAELLLDVYRRLREHETVRAILIHRVREVQTGNPTEDSYGVTRVDGRRKPGFCALVVSLSMDRFC